MDALRLRSRVFALRALVARKLDQAGIHAARVAQRLVQRPGTNRCLGLLPPRHAIEHVAGGDGAPVARGDGGGHGAVLDSIRALMIIRAYRIRGHLAADLDPLGMRDTTHQPELDPASYGFAEADMDRPIFIDNVLGLQVASMREIIEIVRRTYCGTFALQFMHISDPEQAAWLKERIEGYGKEIAFTREGRKAILNKLVEAEGYEKFLHVKYMGTKRFGLDGGESLIPAMEQIIKRGGQLGVKEIVIGMPHRGRLTVLANVLGKPYCAIFNEFQGGSSKPEEVEGDEPVETVEEIRHVHRGLPLRI